MWQILTECSTQRPLPILCFGPIRNEDECYGFIAETCSTSLMQPLLRWCCLVDTLWPVTLTPLVRLPVWADRRTSVRVFEVNCYLPSPILHARGYTNGTDGEERINVFSFFFHVVRHNKELLEVQSWTSRSITHPPAFTAHMHTQMEGEH